MHAGVIHKGLRGNVTMLVDGRACGLLPGVGRAQALRDGRLNEAVVRVEHLPRVQGWVFVNSLRGSAVYPVVAMTT